ncbi:MAG: ribulose phosphate epimerase [Myxococcota bacterium]
MLDFHRQLSALGVVLLAAACGPSQTVPTRTSGASEGTTVGEPTPDPSATGGETTAVSPMTTMADTTLGASTDEGGGFIPVPDGGGDGSECDPFLQDCPVGQKCNPWANDAGFWNDYRCVPVADDAGQAGDPCTVEESIASGLDDCELGAMCWEIDDETLTGVCRNLCTGTPSDPFCEDPSEYCAITSDATITLCLFACDPLQQDCEPGQACYPINSRWSCAPDASRRAGAYGDQCKFINVCDPGLVCLAAAATPGCEGAQGCCSEICDLSDPAGDEQCIGAPEGQTCQAWWKPGEAPPGYKNVGVCALPQ